MVPRDATEAPEPPPTATPVTAAKPKAKKAPRMAVSTEKHQSKKLKACAAEVARDHEVTSGSDPEQYTKSQLSQIAELKRFVEDKKNKRNGHQASSCTCDLHFFGKVESSVTAICSDLPTRSRSAGGGGPDTSSSSSKLGGGCISDSCKHLLNACWNRSALSCQLCIAYRNCE